MQARKTPNPKLSSNVFDNNKNNFNKNINNSKPSNIDQKKTTSHPNVIIKQSEDENQKISKPKVSMLAAVI